MSKKKTKKRKTNTWRDNYIALVAARDTQKLYDMSKTKIKPEFEDKLLNYAYPWIAYSDWLTMAAKYVHSEVAELFRESMGEYTLPKFLKDFRKVSESYNIVRRWQKNKQVFTFDEDFLQELLNTENVKFHRDSWDYIPYNNFFIDLEECSDISALKEVSASRKISGVFVSVTKENMVEFSEDKKAYLFDYAESMNMKSIVKSTTEFYQVNMQIVSKEHCYTTFCILIDNKDDAFGKGQRDFGMIMNLDDNMIKLNAMGVFIFQILNFLSSETPDIIQNPETKRTYKPRYKDAKPKNVYSEIQKWDVGYRYGAAYRKWTSEQEKRKENNEIAGTSVKTGRQVKPHFRRAHWHYYWYGKKTAEKRVKRPVWLAPIPINIENSSNELPAVIHKTKRR